MWKVHIALCLLKGRTELFTHEQGGHLAELLDLFLRQVTFHSEQGTVNRQVYVLGKSFYLMPYLAQRCTALEDELVGERQGEYDLKNGCHPQVFLYCLWR